MSRPRKTVPWCDTRDNGVYYAFWHDGPKGRVLKESLKTRDAGEAAVRFARFLTEGSRASREVGPAGVTVEQVLDWYWAEHVKPNVVDKDRQEDAIAHLKAFFKQKPLKSVDIVESRAYANMRRLHDRSDSTIRRELNVLTAAANHARRWRRIELADMPTIEAPAEARRETAWLTKEQIKKVFDAAEGDLKAFCMIAYYTGARRRSIERLTAAQVDLQHGRIALDPPGARLTKKRRPIVPLYPEIRPIVEKLLDKSPAGALFPKGGDMYRPFVRLLHGLGIEAHPHMLRHSRATHMLMDGEDPYKVAKLLGDTLATVERVYGHHSVDYLKTTSTVEVA